jgi:hypothetical protein
VFEAILIDGSKTSSARTFKKTIKMGTEGIYSTYFVFTRVKDSDSIISLDDRADDDSP